MVGRKVFKAQSFISFALLLFGLTASKCEKEEPPSFQELIFVLNLEINPKDSLVGRNDTLWITAEINDSILE
jgi:hypothetical protein